MSSKNVPIQLMMARYALPARERRASARPFNHRKRLHRHSLGRDH